MYNLLAVSFGEIFLKGKNRNTFEKKAVEQIRSSLRGFRDVVVYKDQGKVFIETKNEDDMDEIINKVKKIFGIVLISPSIKVEKNVEIIKSKTKELIKYLCSKQNIKTFKVETHRSDKTFPIKSMDFSAMMGEEILNEFENLKVDVHNPDIYIYVDIKNSAYISSEKIKTVGGLPVGTSGRALLLLSGGIDSPVAGYMIAKRGVQIDALYFHTYPFTSERANEKVKHLAELLEEYCTI